MGGLLGDKGNVVAASLLLLESKEVISEFKGVNESSRRLLKEFVVDDLGLLMNDFLLLPEAVLWKLLVKFVILVVLLLALTLLLLLLFEADDEDGV